jgi:hypothetical protein
MAADNEVRTTLRLPKSLKTTLQAQADKEHRSWNSHVLAILANHIATQGTALPISDLMQALKDTERTGDGR